MAPPAGETHKRSTANRHRSKCWPEQRAQLAGRESDGGSRFAGRPSTGIRAGWWKRHLGDTIAHGAATTADIISSRGMVELNPILRDSRGQLGARGIGIKLGIFAAVELAKWRIARRHPRDRWPRVLSLGSAAWFTGLAAHNWRLR